MTLSSGTVVRTVGLKEVEAKLLAAQPRIFENNWAMTTAMLDWVKVETAGATPLGPGHFGYHGRDTLRPVVSNHGWTVTGKLVAAVQLYWREYGTGGRSRKQGRALGLGVRELTMAVNQGGLDGGERAFGTAHKALAGARALIRGFYGKALWWRL